MNLRRKLWITAWLAPEGRGFIHVFATEAKKWPEAVKRCEAYLLAPPEQREHAAANYLRWLHEHETADYEAYQRADQEAKWNWERRKAHLLGVRTESRQAGLLDGHPVVELDPMVSDREWADELANRAQQKRADEAQAKQQVLDGYFGLSGFFAMTNSWFESDRLVYSPKPTRWTRARP